MVVNLSRGIRVVACLAAVAGSFGSLVATPALSEPSRHTMPPGGNRSRAITSDTINGRQTRVLLPDGKGPTWPTLKAIYSFGKRAQKATASYSDPKAAVKHGYKRVPQAAPERSPFIQYTNTKNVVKGTGALDPARPTSLYYYHLGNRMLLQGVGFTVPVADTPAQLDALLPPSLALWHGAVDVCRPAGRLTVDQAFSIHTSAACTARGGTFVAAAGWEVNLWVSKFGPALFDPDPGNHDSVVSVAKPVTMSEGAMEMIMLPPSGEMPTWDEIARINKEFAPLAKTLSKYADVSVARKDGYFTATVLDVPSQGAHYVKPQYIPGSISAFDVTRPPVLVYDHGGAGAKLLGLMYLLPAGTSQGDLNKALPSSLAGWHQHVNNCFTASEVLPIHDATACAAHGGLWLDSTGWGAHAWLWDPSTGMFDMDQAAPTG